jgi:GT2 family glycosyltransferase
MASIPGSPEISVIIVNHNGRRWLDGCLSAATTQDTAAVEFILVDNASSDGSVELVRERFSRVRIVLADSNLGFAEGNNFGARLANGRYLAFLNNDTVPARDWVRALRRALELDPTIGLATSQIVYLHDPSIVDSAGDGYLRAGGAFKRLHGEPAALAGESIEVFGACGAAFMIRRDLFYELGGFDADFFMVYEDVDLSFRARLRGHRCVYAADAVVRHAGSATLGRLSPLAVFYGQRNLEWTYLKNMPWPLLLRSLPSHVLYDSAAAVRFASAGLLVPFLRAKWAAFAGIPRVMKKRVGEQRCRRLSATALWRTMDPGWIRRKYFEKQFDFNPGATRTSS